MAIEFSFHFFKLMDFSFLYFLDKNLQNMVFCMPSINFCIASYFCCIMKSLWRDDRIRKLQFFICLFYFVRIELELYTSDVKG